MSGKGGYREGAGRPKGVPNKTTTKTRDAVNLLIESKLERLSVLFDQVAAEDPKGALDILSKLMEYTTPKLARTETKLEIEDKKQFIVEELGEGQDK
jgi:hypothetical protein